MGETSVEEVAAAKSKPTIVVPPRGSVESLFTNGLGGIGFSPGPMTLVSSFFAEQGPFSFSQLLAGAIASPGAAAKPGFLLSGDAGREDNYNSCEDGKDGESGGGYKRNRPMTLVVSPPQMQLSESLSPLFMVPPGLTPSGMLNSPGMGFLSPLQSPFGMSHQQALAHVTAQAAFSQSYMHFAELQRSSYPPAPTEPPPLNHSSPPLSETITEQQQQQQMNPATTELESSKIESCEVSQSEKRTASVAGDKPANDGYNWRKYGQKHVKASECPRSYYKCTYQNCPVKKKVERSFDGRVSEIVYKGEHNHSPPQSSKRRKEGAGLDRATNSHASAGFETNSVDESVQDQSRGSKVGPFSGANQNDEAEGSVIVIDDENDDEPVAKRRAMDNGQSIPASSHQTITESKIVVQTRSEVDLLDDGYKWRKYGQKVVKGNPHPRSYYRCTYAGCNVRKHVERSSADPKAVITTYEGKHNHELPAGRYGSSSSNHGASAANAQLLKTQKMKAAKEPLPRSEMEFGNQAPITLHLKEEQIAA